ncbi:MAG: hypothetical protein ACJ0GV_04440 [Dehalococcoidia bacterium]
MELVVWPDKMEASQFLWETGTYLELDVKTNLRNGSVNMIFEKGKKFEFENQDLEEFVSTNEDTIVNNQVLDQAVTPSIQSNYDEINNLEEKEEVNSPANEPIEIKENPQQINKQFKIEFVGSKNLIEDKYKFEDVIKLLLENKNDNENSNVSIEIFYNEESIELELPLSINYSTELKTRLDLIIGNHNIIIT